MSTTLSWLKPGSHSSPVSQPIPTLSGAEVRQFKREGFLVVPEFLDSAEVARLRSVYDELFESKAGEADNNYCATSPNGGGPPTRFQIRHCSKYAPALKQSRLYEGALQIARQLLGSKADFWGDFAILKPPSGGSPTPWHQDEAFWAPELKYNHIAVWVPLQEATDANGCMQFIPRSHKHGVIPHSGQGGVTCSDLEACGVDEKQAVSCPIPIGAATVHHCRTLHYTGPNTSDGPRRAYILNFGPPTKYRRFIGRTFAWRKPKAPAYKPA